MLAYDFDAPEGVKGYREEILVVPFPKLMGIVGGNLGLFIEFSISGVVTTVLLTKHFKFLQGSKFHMLSYQYIVNSNTLQVNNLMYQQARLKSF